MLRKAVWLLVAVVCLLSAGVVPALAQDMPPLPGEPVGGSLDAPRAGL